MPVLTKTEIDRYHQDGYLAVARPVFRPTHLRRIGSLLDRLFADLDRLPSRWVHDLGTPSLDGTYSIPEVIHTSLLDPRLTLTAVYRACRSIASEILRAPAALIFDHAIVKPARTTSVTPWHQDGAYDPEGPTEVVNFWIPLVEATPNNGCMIFIPNSHQPEELLVHHTRGRDALGAVGVDTERTVPCPVPRGGFTIHTQRTLHSTGPNSTDTDRLTWTLKFTIDERSPATRLADATRRLKRASQQAIRDRPTQQARTMPPGLIRDN
jgi:ectoine hydroxylase-related dioxygenase (phytanoyl-CoA dioxygenase family)